MADYLLDSVSPAALMRATVWRDSEDNRSVIRHTQDVRPILEDNKRAANAYQPGVRPLRHIATLPNVVVMQLQQAGLLDYKGRPADERKLLRFLSDPENRHLRTDNGRRLA